MCVKVGFVCEEVAVANQTLPGEADAVAVCEEGRLSPLELQLPFLIHCPYEFCIEK